MDLASRAHNAIDIIIYCISFLQPEYANQFIWLERSDVLRIDCLFACFRPGLTSFFYLCIYYFYIRNYFANKFYLIILVIQDLMPKCSAWCYPHSSIGLHPQMAHPPQYMKNFITHWGYRYFYIQNTADFVFQKKNSPIYYISLFFNL